VADTAISWRRCCRYPWLPPFCCRRYFKEQSRDRSCSWRTLRELYPGTKEFSVRAARASHGDEVAVLVDAFNDMLEQLQARDASLRAQLERLHLLDQITRAITERLDLRSVFQVVNPDS